MTLVGTKLTAPTTPAQLVTRPRLDDALAAAVDDPEVRVVLVSAPAGSGKSTLVAGWLESTGTPAAWLQADAADHDPARFWAYVVAALARQIPDLESAVAPAIPGSGSDARPLVERLINHLAAATEPSILVVDDYHLISNPAVDRGVEQLVDLAPGSFTLMLCSRVDPSLPLSRLRVRRRLAEVRADDLRFASPEAATLLQHRGASPLPHQVTALCDRTEGWAAGLVLAGISLAGSADVDGFVAAFQGDDRLVVDYLTEEFLSGTSPEDRDRLLRTSILDRLSGPLIDAVCATTDGRAWLHDLATTNQLVISLDRTGTWFRYHHLLADLLRLEADNALGADLAELHRRAGHWHLTAGGLDRAIEHFLAANDLDLATEVIADHAMLLLNSGQLETVEGYLDRVGDDAISTHTRCSIIRGWTHAVTGRFLEAETWLQRVQEFDADDHEAGLIVGLGSMIHLGRGDVAEALTLAQASPEPADAVHAMSLGSVRVWAGLFDEARAHLQKATELARVTSDNFAAAGTPIMHAIIEMETNNPEAAAHEAAKAIASEEEHPIGQSAHMALAYSIIARTSSNPEEAAAAARKGVDLARRSLGSLTMAYALTCAGDLLSHRGEPDGEAFLLEARTIIDRCVDPGIAGTYLARVEGRQGRVVPASRDVGLVEDLTDREIAVLRYLPSAMSQREIGAEMYVSLNTVRTHCKAIYRKLGVGDRKAAVQAARDNGLL